MAKTNYHFSVGNSSEGPIGLCARVIADTPEDALAALCEALPEELLEVQNVRRCQRGQIEYINVYINELAITVDDITPESEPVEEA